MDVSVSLESMHSLKQSTCPVSRCINLKQVAYLCLGNQNQHTTKRLRNSCNPYQEPSMARRRLQAMKEKQLQASPDAPRQQIAPDPRLWNEYLF